MEKGHQAGESKCMVVIDYLSATRTDLGGIGQAAVGRAAVSLVVVRAARLPRNHSAAAHVLNGHLQGRFEMLGFKKFCSGFSEKFTNDTLPA